MLHESEKQNILPNNEKYDSSFVLGQSQLPRSSWDPKFAAFIDEEIVKHKIDASSSRPETAEDEREKTLKRYIKGLGLDLKDLKNKKVVDVGCGDGEFVRELIDKKITQEAYGIDARLSDSVSDQHFIKANFHELIPIIDCDLIVSVGAISNEIWHSEKDEEAKLIIEKIVKNTLDALNENGEIRIYPIQEAFAETPLAGLQKSKRLWDEIVKHLPQKYDVDCHLETSNVRVSGVDSDLVLESVLIIKKRHK